MRTQEERDEQTVRIMTVVFGAAVLLGALFVLIVVVAIVAGR